MSTGGNYNEIFSFLFLAIITTARRALYVLKWVFVGVNDAPLGNDGRRARVFLVHFQNANEIDRLTNISNKTTISHLTYMCDT